MARGNKTKRKNGNGATLGFETKLWQAADKLIDGAMVAIERDKQRLGEPFAQKMQGLSPRSNSPSPSSRKR